MEYISKIKQVFWMNTKSVTYLGKCFNGRIYIPFLNPDNLYTRNVSFKSQLTLRDLLLLSKRFNLSSHLLNNFYFVQHIHIAKMMKTAIYFVTYMLLFKVLLLLIPS